MCDQIAPDPRILKKTIQQFNGQPQKHPKRRPRWQVAVACSCAVAVAVGAMTVLPGMQTAPASSSASPETPLANAFGLVAYAADGSSASAKTMALKLGGDFSALPLSFSSSQKKASTFAQNVPNPSPTMQALPWNDYYGTFGYGLDLTCTGVNIKTITYTIEGDDVSFAAQQAVQDENGNALYTEDAQSGTRTSFTVDYDQQEADQAKITRKLLVSCPYAPEDQARIKADLQDAPKGGADETAESLDGHAAINDRIRYRSAQTLAKARLKLTAAFQDGSTQTKTYQIAPVDDFQNIVADFSKREEAIEKQLANDTQYALTEDEQEIYDRITAENTKKEEAAMNAKHTTSGVQLTPYPDAIKQKLDAKSAMQSALWDPLTKAEKETPLFTLTELF